MKKLLLLITAGLTAAAIYAAVRSGLGSPFWLASSALVIAAVSAALAAGAHWRLDRSRRDYELLAAQFELAIKRLESRDSASQSRLAAVEQAAEAGKAPKRKPAADYPSASDAPRQTADIIPHPKAAANKTAMKPRMIEGGLAAAERMTRQRRAIERGFKKAAGAGQFPLCLQPVLQMPDATPVAFIASGRIAEHDLPAFGELCDGIDRAHYADLMLIQAARVSRQLTDGNGGGAPVICPLNEEFLSDGKRVSQFATAVEAQPFLARSLILALPVMLAGVSSTVRPVVDRLAKAGMRFAVCGNAEELANWTPRPSLPVAFVLANAKDFAGDASSSLAGKLLSLADMLQAEAVALNADGDRLQIAVMERNLRFITSAAAAAPRMVKPLQSAGREIMAG